MNAGRTRIRVRVEGIVQGVGFRPFVYDLAGRHGLAGFVGNDTEGVFAEAEGDPSALAAFVAALRQQAPPLAVVERVTAQPAAPIGEQVFRIVPSAHDTGRDVAISPDIAACAECMAEVGAPGRRHRYPFTNCTNCGPRFTIITDVPYDRARTTMAQFGMCQECAREYHDPGDRRFHAQPVCCPACGPALRLLHADGRPEPADPIATAAAWLREGRILAIKGLGGYHLAALAGHAEAVAALRARKHREDKPFAVMAPDLAAAGELVYLDPAARRLLSGIRRPIVLLRRRPGAAVAEALAPGNRDLGVMLPYTPLHHLLARRAGEPFVLTSGNVCDEPIAYRDEDARQRLPGIADGFLVHDRQIHIRTDDSVVRVFRGRPMPVRRSRGYAPSPLAVPWPFPRPVLACGAELKNTFCVAKGRNVFVSHHIGDLENYETLRSFTGAIEHFCRLFGIRPAVVAHDLHPDYLSTKYALGREDTELTGVQHHHSHIAACLADNGHGGPVIGIAFDGLGFGTDGTLWGGEILAADLAAFERAGHLETVRMPGGAAAIREPWRMAAAYLDLIYGDAPPGLDVIRRNELQWRAVTTLARTGTNAPLTSSVGRLFDAAAAITGVRDRVSYEGQAAVEFEQRAATGERGAYPMSVAGGSQLLLSGRDLVGCVAEDTAAGADVGRIAARFHNGLANAAVRAAHLLRERTGLGDVALSGGVFQNMVLLRRVVSGLERGGFRVLVHSRVPPNDGGVCLGQAAIVAARDRARSAASSQPPLRPGTP